MRGPCGRCRRRLPVRPCPWWTARPSAASDGRLGRPRGRRPPAGGAAGPPGCARSDASSPACRLRPTAVSGLPRPWLLSRRPCDGFPRVARARQQPGGPPTCLTRRSTPPTRGVDPGGPAGLSPRRSLGVGCWGVHPLARRVMPPHGAVSRVRACGLPCGLRGALCPLRRCRAAVLCRLHRCHTREEWWVRPDSAGTYTRPEAPRFAWRTNAQGSAAGAAPPLTSGWATALQSTAVPHVRCNPLFGLVSSTSWP